MKKVVFTILLTVIAYNFSPAQEKLKEKNKDRFGFYFDNLSADQKAFNAETKGVVINRVSKGHQSERAGLQVGDIVTHIDTVAIRDLDHCVSVMQSFDINGSSSARLKIIRNGVKMNLNLVFKQ